MSAKTFTGRNRQRKTRWTVHWTDRIAHWVIAAGGIGTIVAVSLVCFFLIWVVAPLFLPASISQPETATGVWKSSPPLHLAIDDHQLLGAALLPDGKAAAFRLDNGRVLARSVVADQPPTTVSFTVDGHNGALGFADGSVRLGTIGFDATSVEAAALPAKYRSLASGESAAYEAGLLTRTESGRFRLEKLAVKLEPPLQLEGSSAIRRIDYTTAADGHTFCVLTDDGRLRLHSVTTRTNMLTDEVASDIRTVELPMNLASGEKPPEHVFLSATANQVYVAWHDGRLIRFDTGDLDKPRVAEEIDLTPDGANLTALCFLGGKHTLVSGDSVGRVRAWFCIKPEGAETSDGALLTPAHELGQPHSAVTALAAAPRTRMLAAGFADGSVRLYQVTNGRLVVAAESPAGEPVESLLVAPKEDGLLARCGASLAHWRVDVGHPAVSLRGLFRPIWYEGYEGPGYVWQSSSGSEDSEPKYSLIPLIFGTLKGTLYSMLFGVPIALFAALYTSEFLKPAIRARIKPTIEMMASLPSVVLGFLAGAVVAPFVKGRIAGVITSVYLLPVVFCCGAYLWQLLPRRWSLILAPWRFALIALMLPLGIFVSLELGPLVEQWLFGGDVYAWLGGAEGGGTGGWVLLLIPISGLAVAWYVTQVLNYWLRSRGALWSQASWAVVDLVKFMLAVTVTVALAWVAGRLLSALSLDPRGSLVGAYEQQNALVVGFVMGFAIIPLIYTIADDALSTVPDHLRSGSLGSGATQWQTAVRIVIPTAMSGLFSAVMIGLGRAVGETMIMLMAAGSTPIMEWNIFNGFKTLSAVVANEMPEAVQYSTHYRILFLAALTLFGLTFVVNTLAETVRQRFRRRAYEL